MSHLISFSVILEIAILVLSIATVSNSQVIDEEQMLFERVLDCRPRFYSYKVTQTDSEGRMCWDMVTVVSCFGRCDSIEITDFKFPYKASYHPVCIHAEKEPRTVLLQNCEEGIEPGTEIYEYVEAISCKCSMCRSSEANCQGLHYVGQRGSLGYQRG